VFIYNDSNQISIVSQYKSVECLVKCLDQFYTTVQTVQTVQSLQYKFNTKVVSVQHTGQPKAESSFPHFYVSHFQGPLLNQRISYQK